MLNQMRETAMGLTAIRRNVEREREKSSIGFVGQCLITIEREIDFMYPDKQTKTSKCHATN